MDPLNRLAAINPTKHAATLLDEFKAFAFKGNVIDLAVGVIIGAAFGKIVEALVKQVLMPLILMIAPTDKGGFEAWSWTYRGQTVGFGAFLSEIVNFLIIAAALFLFIVKFLGWMLKTKKAEAAAEPAAPPPPTKDQELLAEIRDLLKSGAAS